MFLSVNPIILVSMYIYIYMYNHGKVDEIQNCTYFIQDVVTRYAHQSGFHVERRFGWDCHGLPVEYEIDKTLGIKVRIARQSCT